MKSLVKKTAVRVRLTAQEARDLREAAKLESRRRGRLVGNSTLFRELAMAAVGQLLRELGSPALRSDEDRRSGTERRTPAPV